MSKKAKRKKSGKTGRPARDAYRKLSVTIPVRELERLTREKERLGTNQSDLLERCVNEYLEAAENQYEASIDEGLVVKLRLIELIVGDGVCPDDEQRALEIFERTRGERHDGD